MAFVKIRGGQIQDAQVSNQHIAADAAISESKLAINWSSHAGTILAQKKVVDFVQVNKKVASGTLYDLTTLIPNTTARATSADVVEGVLVDNAKNKAVVRKTATGEPILDVNGREVFGRVEFVPSPDAGVTPDTFVLKFFVWDPTANAGAGAEVAHTLASQEIDFQYAQRFNLDSVNEMFAANEKFVDGVADVTSNLNIQQLAKDLYGAGFSLDRDGNANLSVSVVADLLAQTSGVTNTGVRAKNIIDEVVTARGSFGSVQARFTDIETNLAQEITNRGTAVTGVRTDLASVAAGKGASLVGVEDISGKFTAVTVEGVLTEIDDRIINNNNASSATTTEVQNARLSTVKSADAGVTPKTFASLDGRLEEAEQDHKTLADAVTTQNTANGTRFTNIETLNTTQNGRLDSVETLNTTQNNRLTALELIDHAHKKFVYQATGGETSVNLTLGDTFTVGNDSLDVYVQGMLQAKSINYTEKPDGTGVDFSPTALAVGDVVTLRYWK